MRSMFLVLPLKQRNLAPKESNVHSLWSLQRRRRRFLKDRPRIVSKRLYPLTMASPRWRPRLRPLNQHPQQPQQQLLHLTLFASLLSHRLVSHQVPPAPPRPSPLFLSLRPHRAYPWPRAVRHNTTWSLLSCGSMKNSLASGINL